MAKDARARAPERTIENLAAMTEAIAEIPEKRQDGFKLGNGQRKGAATEAAAPKGILLR